MTLPTPRFCHWAFEAGIFMKQSDMERSSYLRGRRLRFFVIWGVQSAVSATQVPLPEEEK
jgi:hypothetical protein